LLRRFGALGKNSTAGLSSDNAGGMSRLGTVLRESIYHNLNLHTDDETLLDIPDGLVSRQDDVWNLEEMSP
jgi:hypothetical protein